MINRIRWWHVTLLGLLLFAAGCQETGNQGTGGNERSNGEGAAYLLAEEPAGAKGVREVKETATDGEEIVVEGRVGGGNKPFLDGLAGFTIVDPALKSCSDIPGDNCETPWDYCCEDQTEVNKGMAFVKIVDEGGETLKKDARSLLGLDLLQTVVVRGKAKRDANGNLTVLASALYVRGKKP